MRIVHIEDFFHPDAGYQVNLLSKYMVAKGHEVIIITAEMDLLPEHLTSFFGKEQIEKKDAVFESKYGVKIIRIPLKRYVSGRAIYQDLIFETVNLLKPDILFVHGNDTMIGMQYIKKANALDFPLILDSHMLDIASVNKFSKLFHYYYRRFITPKIIANKITVIRTQNDVYVQKKLGIPIEQCPWISVGTDTLLFRENECNKAMFRKEYGVSEKDFVIGYVGKLDKAKGGLFLANAIKDEFAQDNKTPVFVIVGNATAEEGTQIEHAFKNSKNRIIRFSTRQYNDLAKYYQAMDLVVYPKQCSLSFFDAQACGVPVLFEDNSINIERSVAGNAFLFKSMDLKDFRNKIESIMKMPAAEYSYMRRNSIEYIKMNYDYENLVGEYLEIIQTAIRIFNRKRKE